MKVQIQASLLSLVLITHPENIVHGQDFLQKYDESTQTFLDLFPEEITSDESLVEEVLKKWEEDPSAFDQVFADAGIDLVAMGIVPAAPSNASNGTVAEKEDDTSGSDSSGMGDTITGLFELGSKLVIDSGLLTGSGHPSNGDVIMANELPPGVTYVDGKLVFDSNERYPDMGLDSGMAQVAAYFGIDPTNADEVEIFTESLGSCEFCDEKDINVDMTFAGLDCTDWFMFSLFSKHEECSVLRAAAVQYCGCSTTKLAISPETNKCNLCMDGSLEGVDLEQRIPTMSDELLCKHLVDIRAVEGQKTCDAISGFDYICGCRGSTPRCHLCPDGSAPTRPEALLQTGPASVSCAEFEEVLWMDTPSSCPDTIQEFQEDVGISSPAFCGCPNVPAPSNGCRPCKPGYKLKENLSEEDVHLQTLGMSCYEWALERAPFTVNQDVCEMAQSQVESKCCEEMTEAEMAAEYASVSAASSAPVMYDFTVFVAFQAVILLVKYLSY